jgi:hypothetical protein
MLIVLSVQSRIGTSGCESCSPTLYRRSELTCIIWETSVSWWNSGGQLPVHRSY